MKNECFSKRERESINFIKPKERMVKFPTSQKSSSPTSFFQLCWICLLNFYFNPYFKPSNFISTNLCDGDHIQIQYLCYLFTRMHDCCLLEHLTFLFTTTTIDFFAFDVTAANPIIKHIIHLRRCNLLLPIHILFILHISRLQSLPIQFKPMHLFPAQKLYIGSLT